MKEAYIRKKVIDEMTRQGYVSCDVQVQNIQSNPRVSLVVDPFVACSQSAADD